MTNQNHRRRGFKPQGSRPSSERKSRAIERITGNGAKQASVEEHSVDSSLALPQQSIPEQRERTQISHESKIVLVEVERMLIG